MRPFIKRTLFILSLAALMVVLAFMPALAAVNQIVWKKFFSDTPESQHVATDRNGNIVVAENGTTSQIRKYSAGGSELWMRPVQIQGRDTSISDMAVDRGGNAYVVGNHFGGFGSFIRKYGPRGGHHWTRRLWNAWIENVAVGPGGSVYVVGSYLRTDATFIKKYNSQGKFLWSRRAPFASMADVAVGPGGGVYISAYDPSVFLDDNGEFDVVLYRDTLFMNSPVVLRKYSPRGGIYWTRRVHFVDNGYYRYRLIVDRAGGVIFTPHGDGGDSFITKFSHGGRRLWTRRWSSHVTNDIAVDKDRNIYVMGESSDEKAFVRMYLPNGTRMWTRYFINGQALGGATDSDGNLYVTGLKGTVDAPSFLAKFRQ